MGSFKRMAKTVAESLEVLDRNAKRKGWVNLTSVQGAFYAMTKQQAYNHEHALMLIRCCGNLLVHELPNTRQYLAEKMFREFKYCLPGGFQLVHLNSLLRVGLQNLRPCSTHLGPKELIDLAESHNIETNDLFWQLILEWHCLNGNSDDACSHALSKIKCRPTAKMYNLLIYSYLISGKPGNAEAVANEQDQCIDSLGKIMRVLMLANKQNDDKEAVRLLDSYSVNYEQVSPLADKSYDPLLFLMRYSSKKQFNLLLNRSFQTIEKHSWPLLPLSLSLLRICQELIINNSLTTAEKSILAFPSSLDTISWQFLIRVYVRYCVLLGVDCKNICLLMEKKDFCQGHYSIHSALRESLMLPHQNDFIYWFAKQKQYPLKLHYLYPLLTANNKHIHDILLFAFEQFGETLGNDTNFLKLTVLALMEQGCTRKNIQQILGDLNVYYGCEQILNEPSDF